MLRKLLQWKTGLNRGCCFLVQAMLPEGFPFHQFKPPMFFIDHTKAVIQHFLEKSFKQLKIENKDKNRKIRKTQKNSYFLMSVASLYTPCVVMFCVFLYGPICHGAHKLDLSAVFTTFFLWTFLHLYWKKAGKKTTKFFLLDPVANVVSFSKKRVRTFCRNSVFVYERLVYDRYYNHAQIEY